MRHYLQDAKGATAGEYALILAIIGAAIALSSLLLGDAVSAAMNNASSVIASATGSNSGAAQPPGPNNPSPPGNPNACPGCNSGNGNTDPGAHGGGRNH